mmetsp:Transcript_15159/g.45392  ORF Transcript_15159/g.45392 Transcript_15159/m.45392 type:complete len:375 (-) Transcript_15159:68-1192(-)
MARPSYVSSRPMRIVLTPMTAPMADWNSCVSAQEMSAVANCRASLVRRTSLTRRSNRGTFSQPPSTPARRSTSSAKPPITASRSAQFQQTTEGRPTRKPRPWRIRFIASSATKKRRKSESTRVKSSSLNRSSKSMVKKLTMTTTDPTTCRVPLSSRCSAERAGPASLSDRSTCSSPPSLATLRSHSRIFCSMERTDLRCSALFISRLSSSSANRAISSWACVLFSRRAVCFGSASIFKDARDSSTAVCVCLLRSNIFSRCCLRLCNLSFWLSARDVRLRSSLLSLSRSSLVVPSDTNLWTSARAAWLRGSLSARLRPAQGKMRASHESARASSGSSPAGLERLTLPMCSCTASMKPPLSPYGMAPSTVGLRPQE